jgi:phage tail sheath gpL-like
MAGQAGTGYAVNDTINCGNGVSLKVLTVTTGAVATVSILNGGSIALGAVPPVNPVSQFSSSGAGIGAKFTLTWTNQVVAFAGSATPDVPVAIGTQAQADDKFGEGSELALMFHAYFHNNFANEVWAGPVLQSAGAVAATGTITVSAPPGEAGTIHLYIGGHHVPINVGSTDTNNDVAAEIVNQIMDDLNQPLPVTATAVANAITLTATFPGVNGNDIRV